MCDTALPAQPADFTNCKDPIYEVYCGTHRKVARYSLKLKGCFPPSEQLIDSGLTWDEATRLRDRLQRARRSPRFGDPVYCIDLENGDEARAAVRAAADKYWSGRA